MSGAPHPAPTRRPTHGLAALRRLAAAPAAREFCELCASRMPGEHGHLVDPQTQRLLCACPACAILFDHSGVTGYRRVPREAHELPGLVIADVFWSGLAVPIDLVFFFRSSASGEVAAVYPSPAGPTRAAIDAETWRELAALDPALQHMRDDVEALLVNRVRGARSYWIAPIDQCYRLVGIVRRHWRGFSGGDEAWRQIQSFFDTLGRGAEGGHA